ncbi:MAG TPA: SRPBCC family protein [Gemmatimonadaceae bacterium]|nr:SRPBCC family protein [Gemmatimonadaceae bacterium]
MNVQRSAVVHTSILAPPDDVIAFLRDLENWKAWAPWIHSVTRLSGRDWKLETEAGPMTVHFTEPNSLGVLDHEVTLTSGVTVVNSMRVLPNDEGSELVMVLFQSPSVSADDFDRDIQAVTDDLARLKPAAEAFMREAAR